MLKVYVILKNSYHNLSLEHSFWWNISSVLLQFDPNDAFSIQLPTVSEGCIFSERKWLLINQEDGVKIQSVCMSVLAYIYK